MKKRLFFPSLLLFSLASCNASTSIIEERAFYFDTYIDIKMYEGSKDEAKEIMDIFKTYSLVSDNYKTIFYKFRTFYKNYAEKQYKTEK